MRREYPIHDSHTDEMPLYLARRPEPDQQTVTTAHNTKHLHEDTVWQGSRLDSEYYSDARMLFGGRVLQSAAHDDHSDDDGPEVQSKPQRTPAPCRSPPSIWRVLCQPTRRVANPDHLPRPCAATQPCVGYVAPEIPVEWESEE